MARGRKPSTDTCPTCNVEFASARHRHPSGIGNGKTCPNGHYTPTYKLRKPPPDSKIRQQAAWTVDQLVSNMTWFVLEGLTRGKPLRSLIHQVCDAARNVTLKAP